jgi:hypothetical protein
MRFGRREMFDPAGALEREAKLDRQQAAAALTARGYKTTASTLATLASRGGGPIFQKFGPRVIYRWADLLAWANDKTSQPVTNTSELKASPALLHCAESQSAHQFVATHVRGLPNTNAPIEQDTNAANERVRR